MHKKAGPSRATFVVAIPFGAAAGVAGLAVAGVAGLVLAAVTGVTGLATGTIIGDITSSIGYTAFGGLNSTGNVIAGAGDALSGALSGILGAGLAAATNTISQQFLGAVFGKTASTPTIFGI